MITKILACNIVDALTKSSSDDGSKVLECFRRLFEAIPVVIVDVQGEGEGKTRVQARHRCTRLVS